MCHSQLTNLSLYIWACEILWMLQKLTKKVLPRRGIEPRPRRWERRILTTRPPGICISEGFKMHLLYLHVTYDESWWPRFESQPNCSSKEQSSHLGYWFLGCHNYECVSTVSPGFRCGLRGATVARLTPDQKVACSNHVGVNEFLSQFYQCWNGVPNVRQCTSHYLVTWNIVHRQFSINWCI